MTFHNHIAHLYLNDLLPPWCYAIQSVGEIVPLLKGDIAETGTRPITLSSVLARTWKAGLAKEIQSDPDFSSHLEPQQLGVGSSGGGNSQALAIDLFLEETVHGFDRFTLIEVRLVFLSGEDVLVDVARTTHAVAVRLCLSYLFCPVGEADTDY